jgi:uncharacterized membrane protein YtjA (UPF0391 family)
MLFSIVIPIISGVLVFFAVTSGYRWIRILGYFITLLLFMIFFFQAGYQYHKCGPEPIKLWM